MISTEQFDSALQCWLDGNHLYTKHWNWSTRNDILRQYTEWMFNRRRKSVEIDGVKVSDVVLQAMENIHGMSRNRAIRTYKQTSDTDLWDYMPVTVRSRLENRLYLKHVLHKIFQAEFCDWSISDSVPWYGERFFITSVDVSKVPDGTYSIVSTGIDTTNIDRLNYKTIDHGTVVVKGSNGTLTNVVANICEKPQRMRIKCRESESIRPGVCFDALVTTETTMDHQINQIRDISSNSFVLEMENLCNSKALFAQLPNFAEGFFLAAERMMEIRQTLDIKEAVETTMEYVEYNDARRIRRRLENAKSISNFKVSIDCEDDKQFTPLVPLKLQIHCGADGENIIFVMSSDGTHTKIDTVHGMVHRDGSCWFTSHAIEMRLLAFLQKWNDECMEGTFFDWLFGVSKGTCIFCNRPIWQEDSKLQGSGAICRNRYMGLWRQVKNHVGFTVEKTDTHVAGLCMQPVKAQRCVFLGKDVPSIIIQQSSVLQGLICDTDEDDVFDLTDWMKDNILMTDGLIKAYDEVPNVISTSTRFVARYYTPPPGVSLADLVYILVYLGMDNYANSILKSPRVEWMARYSHLMMLLNQNLPL